MNNGGPAFPALNYIVPQDLADKDVHRLGETQGMSLRDYFAAKAMQGFASSIAEFDLTFPELAEDAYNFADAMLKAREES